MDATSDRSVTVDSWTPHERIIRVGTGVKGILSIPENFNRGWHATADGKELTSLRVEGWQQGWRLPSSRSSVVELSFEGQTVYLLALALGAALALGLLVATGLVVRSDPHLPPAPAESTAVRVPGRRARIARRLSGLLLLAVVAPWLAAGVLLGQSRLRVARSFVVPLALMLATAGMDVAGLPFFWAVAADAVTAIAIGWALAPALRRGTQ